MKITDLTLELFAWEKTLHVVYGAHTAQQTGIKSCLGLVRIRTDEGIEGHAFLGTYTRSAELDALSLVRALKPMVIGEDPLDRERLHRRLMQRTRMTSYRAIGAVDVALWDIAGKAAGVPIHKLIGGFRDSVPAYASSPVLGSLEEYVEQALQIKEAGWAAYKIHPPARWKEDIAICEAVRKAVGDDFTLMLDSTWAYTYDQALRVGHAIQEMNYHWYEDPLPQEDIYGYVKLKQHVRVPILATEYASGGFHGYASWIMQQATDALRGDPAVKGGLTPCLKTAHLAEAFSMNYEMHHGGNSLVNLANLHLICAIANSEFLEVLLPDDVQKYAVLNDIIVGSDGRAHAPSGPGLGADIDFDVIRRNSVALLE